MKTQEDSPTLIAIPTIHGFDLIDRNIITHLKGERNQTAIYIEGKPEPVISSACLKHYQDILPRKMFIRIHKSYIISLKYPKKYIKGKFSHVLLINNISLSGSLSYRDTFLSLLDSLR